MAPRRLSNCKKKKEFQSEGRKEEDYGRVKHKCEVIYRPIKMAGGQGSLNKNGPSRRCDRKKKEKEKRKRKKKNLLKCSQK